jgi:hypothetical protein
MGPAQVPLNPPVNYLKKGEGNSLVKQGIFYLKQLLPKANVTEQFASSHCLNKAARKLKQQRRILSNKMLL